MFAKIAIQDTENGSLISAKNDKEAADLFYKEKKSSTKAAFEREIRRFFYWIEAQDITLKDLTHNHVKAYKELLESPPKEACGPSVKYFLDKERTQVNPKWKPFNGALSGGSVKTAINLLGSFGKWLADAGYLTANPFSLVNRNSDSDSTIKNQKILKTVDVEHHFTPVEMYWMDKSLEELIESSDSTKKRKVFIRGRFILSFLRRTGLRREEMVRILNNNIKKVYLPKMKKTVYVIHGVGKGDKAFKLPLHHEVLDKLKDYRVSIGLSPMPPQDDFDTILKTKTGKNFSTPTSLYRDVKELFDLLAEHILTRREFWSVSADNTCDFDSLVANLRQASPHWMRHSFITENAATISDPRKLQEIARHSSLDTTALYLHTTIEELTEVMDKL